MHAIGEVPSVNRNCNDERITLYFIIVARVDGTGRARIQSRRVRPNLRPETWLNKGEKSQSIMTQSV